MGSKKPGCLSIFFPRTKAFDQENLEIDVSQALPYRVRDDFLSNAELSFYHVLKTMAGEKVTICPKVSLAEIFFVNQQKDFYAFQNRINRKRIDFLLCDAKTLDPILAIELDDSSHQRQDRIERDAFVDEVFKNARLPLVHIPVRTTYNMQELALVFKSVVHDQAAANQPPAPAVQTPSGVPICPKCGVAMVVRTAKRGAKPNQQFFGCPNYPRCRVILPIPAPAAMPASPDPKEHI